MQKTFFRLLFLLTFLPGITCASAYTCSGLGFLVTVSLNPPVMKITGNGFNSVASNIRITSTFDTVFSGNVVSPASTLNLTVKDSSFGSPGESFKGALQISSSAGIKEFTDLMCIKGND